MEIFTMTIDPIVIQILGYAGFLCIALSFQSNVRARILYIQMAGLLLMGLHLGFQGAYSGALMMVVLIFRNILFSYKERYQWARHYGVLVVTSLVILVFGLVGWEGWFSIFPVFGSLFGTVAFWMDRPRIIRFMTLGSVAIWVPYTFIIMSVPLMCLQAFMLVSLGSAMWRYDRQVFFRKKA